MGADSNMTSEKLTRKSEMEGENERLLGNPDNEKRESEPDLLDEEPDGGWGWLVVFACFLTTFVLDGIGYSFGMFMEPLKLELGEGNFGVASIGSIQVNFNTILTQIYMTMLFRLQFICLVDQ